MKECTRPSSAPTLLIAAAALIVCGLPLSAQSGRSKVSSQKATAHKPAAASADSAVVATVDGDKITRQEIADDLVADQMAQLAVTNPKFMNAARARPVAASIGALVMQKMAKSGGKPVTITRDEAVDWLFKDKQPIVLNAIEVKIREMVVKHEAKKRGIVATPEEVAAKTAESLTTARQSLQVDKSMSDKKLLEMVGYREESLKRGVVISLLLEKILDKQMEAKFGHKLGPADFVDASHILVKVQVTNPTDKDKLFEEARKKIQGYADDIKSGKITFEAAAQQYSDDPSKFQKGSLGVFMRGSMVPEFDKAAFELEPGKLSEPVRTVYGWHLIKVNRQGKDTTGPERANVVKRYQQSNMQTELSKLVAQAKVVNNVAPKQPTTAGMPIGAR